MKRIMLFVFMLGALNSMAQTTGYLRFDTVRIFKQGGTAELYLINSTKDSLGQLTNVGGGLTRFIKPRKLNDSTLTIGLDTISLAGNTQLFDLLDTRIAFGDANNQITDDADLTYSAATNRFNTGTGNFADSVLVGKFRQGALTDSVVVFDNLTRALKKMVSTGWIQNQNSAQQNARYWVDSARIGNLSISPRAGGGQPTLHSTSIMWFMATNRQYVFTGLGTAATDYPVLQLTHFTINQAYKYSGLLLGFNFANNSVVTNKPLVLATSGFSSNPAAGDIILSPGRLWNGTELLDTRTTGNWNVIVDPANNGELQVNKITNMQYGWKTKDSISSSTTITITVAAPVWIFTGSSTATWTLPALSGNEDVHFFIKNKGSADIVLTAGTNEIYSSSATTTFNITAGQGYMVRNDGTHWTVLNN